GVERVSIHDNFFEIGGHSLLATQVVSRLRQVLSVELPLRALFEAPTVAGLADQLSAQRSETQRPLQPVDRAGPLPLSFAQQRLWFLDQLEPGSPLYNLPAGLRLRGTLDHDALRHSLDRLIARHESLRTTFAAVQGQPVQVIAPAAPLDLTTVDLRPLPPDERQAAAMELATEDARQPFDLQRGPLLRATLVLLDQDEHLLLFTLHHIITDGWSLGVLIREVAATYQALSSQHPHREDTRLPELPIQYADYAVWQRAWLQGEVLQQQLSYWRQQLQGSVPLDLPTDRPRPSISESTGTHLALRLSAELSAGLQSLSQRLGATLFMTLLAAWQTLLHRYSGQTDISVGSPIAGRVRPELEDLIGFFVNTLVLRTDLSGSPTFADLVSRVRQVALGAYAHQDLPFEQIVDAVQPERDLSRTPLFQVMFVLQNTPRAAIETPDLQLEPLEIEKQSALFDLTLTMIETPAGLVGALEYRTDLFDAATIERMAGRFQTLLAAIVADPQQRIDRLPLLDAAEQQAMLSAWNTTEQPYPHDLCLHDLVAAQARRTPEAVALIFGDERLAYGELDRQANQLAHHLQKLGVGPDVRVGVCLDRSIDVVVSLLAVLKAGGCYVPLDPTYPSERLAFMLDDARAGVLLTSESLVAALPMFGNTIVCLDRDQAQIASQPLTSPAADVQPANLAYMIYTSGSTGRPKAVMVAHQAICNHLHWRQHAYPLGATDRFLHKASFSFDISVWECFAPLIAGAALVLASGEEAQSSQALVKLIADEQVTMFHAGPALLRLLLDEPRIAECRAVRHVFSGGEQLTLDLKQRCLTRLGWATLHHQYGPTEACVDATVWTCARDEAEATIPIGRPIANTQAYILDAQMQPVPIGVAGELYLGGLGLARGYHQQRALTATQFVPDPFGRAPGARLYKTGDLARYRADGAIVFLGRVDFQVKLRGFRVELGEIEAVLATHPAVQTALVVLRDERLVAYIVGEPRTQNLEPRSTEQGNKQTKEQTET
ncbi:MAG TPA: amino acid adenylation domain-containing protein, partial [Herpetosiphonaceae bacterium]